MRAAATPALESAAPHTPDSSIAARSVADRPVREAIRPRGRLSLRPAET